MLNVDETEYVAERNDGSQWVKVLVDMGYHFKSFAIKSMFFDKEVRHRRLAVIGNNLLPLDVCGSIEIRCGEFLGFVRPIRGVA